MKQRTLAALLTTALTAGWPIAVMSQDQQNPETEAEPREDIPELAEDLEEEIEDSNGSTPEERTMEQEVEEYEAREKLIGSVIGGFVPYRPTYILPYTYVDNPNQTPGSPTQGKRLTTPACRARKPSTRSASGCPCSQAFLTTAPRSGSAIPRSHSGRSMIRRNQLPSGKPTMSRRSSSGSDWAGTSARAS